MEMAYGMQQGQPWTTVCVYVYCCVILCSANVVEGVLSELWRASSSLNGAICITIQGDIAQQIGQLINAFAAKEARLLLQASACFVNIQQEHAFMPGWFACAEGHPIVFISIIFVVRALLITDLTETVPYSKSQIQNKAF